MSDVETRLAALERSVRRWRLGACVAGVALAAVVAIGAQREPAAVTPMLEANGIRLVDQDGKEAFAVTADRQRGAVLTMRVGSGAVLVGSGKDGPFIGLRGRQQKIAARLAATDAGGQLRLYDADEKGTYSAPE